MSGRLANKVAIITGAGRYRYLKNKVVNITIYLFIDKLIYSGIGFESSVLFASEGARVVCADINIEAAQATVKRISEVTGDKDRAMAVRVDVSQEKEVERLVDMTVEKFDGLDVMFNNAGIMHPKDNDALNTDEAIWQVE
jgi:NAD(P)-dependent dehydrogenase (short-subunit alcohol dehydrogenase family)